MNLQLKTFHDIYRFSEFDPFRITYCLLICSKVPCESMKNLTIYVQLIGRGIEPNPGPDVTADDQPSLSSKFNLNILTFSI